MAKNWPEIIVGALVYNDSGRVFLMAGVKWANRLIVPGGHVEFGESLEYALEREIREETGFAISNIQFLNVDESITKDLHYVFVNYLCAYAGGELKLNSEAVEGNFFEYETALEKDLAAPTRRLLIAAGDLLKERRMGGEHASS